MIVIGIIMNKIYLNLIKNRTISIPHPYFFDYIDYIGCKDGKECTNYKMFRKECTNYKMFKDIKTDQKESQSEFDSFFDMYEKKVIVRDTLNNKDVSISSRQYDAIIVAANKLAERAEANGLFDYTDGFAWDKVEGKNTLILSVRRTITDGVKTYQWMLDIQ